MCQGLSSPCLTFDPPLNYATADFGSSVAILGDIDGGGKRDLAITTRLTPSSTYTLLIVRGESSGPSNILATIPAVEAGTVVIPAGQVSINNTLVDLIAVSRPSAGDVALYRFQPPTPWSGGLYNVLPVGAPLTPPGLPTQRATFGTSMTMVDTMNGMRLAVGYPQSDQVWLFALSGTGATLQQTLVPWHPNTSGIPIGSPSGSFGASMAVGPKRAPNGVITQSVLAVGAPNYSPNPLGTSSPATGMVAIFDLSQTLPGPSNNTANQFLYRAVPYEQFGSAVASVGFLPEPSPFGSSLCDFVVFGRRQQPFGNSVIGAFHTPNLPSQNAPATPTYGIPITNLPTTSDPTNGRLVASGDVDGDGLGDVALAFGTSVRLYSTKGQAFTDITPAAPNYGPIVSSGGITKSLAIASGPDISGKGGTDVVIGARRVSPAGGLVEILPMAANILLPNTGNVTLQSVGTAANLTGRPKPGTLQMLITAPQGSLVVLFGAFAPPQPAPFIGGPALSYLPGGYFDLGFGVTDASGQLTLPVTIPNGFNFEGLVFQALRVDPFGNLSVSNGLLSRIGSW